MRLEIGRPEILCSLPISGLILIPPPKQASTDEKQIGALAAERLPNDDPGRTRRQNGIH